MTVHLWPFLVSRSKDKDYSAIVVPRPFANTHDERAILDWLDQDSGPDPTVGSAISRSHGEVSLLYRVIPAIDGDERLMDHVGRTILWIEGVVALRPAHSFGQADNMVNTLSVAHHAVIDRFRETWKQGLRTSHVSDPLPLSAASVKLSTAPASPPRMIQMRFHYWRAFVVVLGTALVFRLLAQLLEVDSLTELRAQNKLLLSRLEDIQGEVQSIRTRHGLPAPDQLERAGASVDYALAVASAQTEALEQLEANQREPSSRGFLIWLAVFGAAASTIVLSWRRDVLDARRSGQ